MNTWFVLLIAVSTIQVNGDEYIYKYGITQSYVEFMVTELTNLKAVIAEAGNTIVEASFVYESFNILNSLNAQAKSKGSGECAQGLDALISGYVQEAEKVKATCSASVSVTYLSQLQEQVELLSSTIQQLDNDTYNNVQKCSDSSCVNAAQQEGLDKLKSLKDANLPDLRWFYQMAYSSYYDQFRSCFDTNTSALLRNILQTNYATQDCLET